MDTKQILINNIDLSSREYDKFLLSYGRNSETTENSINKVGLINSVILTEGKDLDRSFTIVCGSLRIKAFQKSGINIIKANVIEGLNDEELLLLSLHDNLFSRRFNEIEKAIAIKKFMGTGYSYDRVAAEIAPLLDLPPNKKILDKYVSLLRLNDEIKNAVASNELELERVFLLMQLKDADREIVYKVLFNDSCTNLNETRETIRNLLDLKLMKQKEIKELLTSSEISGILSDTKANKRQKGEKVYKVIKIMRYPAISEKEEAFSKSCKKLGLDNHVRVNHSRYFEGDDIQITLKAANEETLKGNIEKLLANINNGTFKKLFSIYKS